MSKIQEEILPNALMIGVAYELFWRLNPKTIKPFFKAFRLKQEYDDLVSWQNGMYVRLAVASLLDKKAKYPERPLSMKSKPEDTEMPQEIIMNKFLNQMELLNSRFKGKEVNSGE